MSDTCSRCGQTIGYDCNCTEIERLTAERDRYKARAERAEWALRSVCDHIKQLEMIHATLAQIQPKEGTDSG